MLSAWQRDDFAPMFLSKLQNPPPDETDSVLDLFVTLSRRPLRIQYIYFTVRGLNRSMQDSWSNLLDFWGFHTDDAVSNFDVASGMRWTVFLVLSIGRQANVDARASKI